MISLLSKGLPRVFSNTTVQNHQFFSAQPFLWSSSHPYMTTGNPSIRDEEAGQGKGRSSRFFTSGGQSIGASASASVLSMKIQVLFSLGLTGLISLLSKGLSRIFSNTTVQKHQFSAPSLLYGSTLTSIHDYWKNHSFDNLDFCWKSNVSAF